MFSSSCLPSTTESPRKNILLTKRSLFTGLALDPLPVRGVSVHIYDTSLRSGHAITLFRESHTSLTFSRTILQWRSNALTRASILWLLRQLMRIWLLFLTDCWRTDNGPVLNSTSSNLRSSSSVISDLGLPLVLWYIQSIRVPRSRQLLHTSLWYLMLERKEKCNGTLREIELPMQLSACDLLLASLPACVFHADSDQ